MYNIDKIFTNLATWGGPIGAATWAIYNIAQNIDQCEIEKEGKGPDEMATFRFKDRDVEYSLLVPKPKVKRYWEVLCDIQFRLEKYRYVYENRRSNKTILRLLALDLAAVHHPIDFSGDRAHAQFNVCDETIDATIKKSDVWFYRTTAKRISDRYKAIIKAQGDNINEEAALWLMLFEIDSNAFL